MRARAEPFLRLAYRVVLCREMSDSEVEQHWRGYAPGEERAFIERLLASAEFRSLLSAFSRAEGPEDPVASERALGRAGTDAEFVAVLYRWLLGREPDAAGLAHYCAALSVGDPRLTVVRSLLASPEFAQRYANSVRPVPCDVQLCELANPAKWDNPEWMSLLRELEVVTDDKRGMHRKGYEFTQLLFGLRRLGQLRRAATVVSVGAGHEAVLYWLANHVHRVIATDMYEDEWAAGSSRAAEGDAQVLRRPETYAPFPYRQTHLQFMRMDGRFLAFADGSFDVAYSLSSIEHFGGFEGAAAAVDDMIRVVRPGGIVAVATEYRLAGPAHPEVFEPEQVQALFNRPRARLVEPIDERVYARYDCIPIDLHINPYGSPHMVVKIGETAFTSVFGFLEKLG